jgi:hypothetical protein
MSSAKVVISTKLFWPRHSGCLKHTHTTNTAARYHPLATLQLRARRMMKLSLMAVCRARMRVLAM